MTTSSDLPYDMVDYIVSLREGIMDAWGGILLSYKGTPSSTLLFTLHTYDLNMLISLQSPNSSLSSSLSSSFFTLSPRRATAAKV